MASFWESGHLSYFFSGLQRKQLVGQNCQSQEKNLGDVNPI